MAYQFVTDDDIRTVIKTEMMGHVNEGDVLLNEKAEATAIKQMKNYLKERYDVQAIFTATGTDRDELILTYCIDILLYHIHSRINPRKVPTLRMERYKEAIEWLKMVKSGDMSPELPVPVDEDGVEETSINTVRYGGGIKETEHEY